MVQAPATILGGLPVIAEVVFGYDSGSAYSPAEYYSEVEGIFWMKRNGKPGKPIPDHLWERAEKDDPYFAGLIDQVTEHLVHEAAERERDERVSFH